MPLVIISVLFGLSLLAAYVLFKVLKSTATVTKPEYQLGGAAAGFVVILTILSFTYMQVDNKKQQDNINDLRRQLDDARSNAEKGKQCLDERAAADVIYSGTVTPPLQNANVVLAVSSVQLQPDGRFAIKVHNVKPADFPYIYVIGADSRSPYRQVFATDDPEKLRIPPTNP
jgi:hypothetical protein